MNPELQEKIKAIVNDYKMYFPAEYEAFKQGQPVKIDKLKNEFASTETDSVIEQHILDYPETLYTMLKMQFVDGEWKQFDEKKMVRWFAKTFPEFAIAQKI